MLQHIRDRLNGPVVWVVIGLICVPFAFWGIESFRSEGGDPVAAEVGDEEITQSQLEQGYQQRYQQLQSLLGDNFRADLFDATRFRQSVLDDMVQESLLRQHARDAGFQAGDALLFSYLSTIPAFQQDGKFSATLYRERLQAQGLDVTRFESQLRESLVIEQLREAVVESGFSTGLEAQRRFQLAQQQRSLRTVTLQVAPLMDAVVVTDEQIQQRYDGKIDQYQAPERIKLAYVDLDAGRLTLASAPTPEMLRAIYDAEKDGRFSAPEERRARHVLVSFGADKAAALQKVEGLAGRIKAGEDFSKLASAESDDSGSRESGGDLGWVKRGMMVQAFEDGLYALEAAGAVSEPVESEFGYHLIRLEEIKPAQVRDFSEAAVQEEIKSLFETRDRERRFQELSEQLEQLAFENPASLEAVAKAVGQPVQTTDWLGRAGGAGIAANPAVMEAAFSTEVLQDGENSKPLALGAQRVVVLRKAEYEPARTRALEEVRDAIRGELKREGAIAAARQRAGGLSAAVAAGKTPSAALAEASLTASFEGTVGRRASAVDAAVVAAAFRLVTPAPGQASVDVVDLPSGDIVWVAVEAVQMPALPGEADPQLKKFAGESRDALAGAEFGAYRERIKAAIPAEIRSAAPASAPQES